MRHQLSPPAGQKERTRVQANNGTKLEVERAHYVQCLSRNLCYYFIFKFGTYEKSQQRINFLLNTRIYIEIVVIYVWIKVHISKIMLLI